MVKVKDPFASLRASGTFGRELQYANTLRGGVAGRRRRPSQPRTVAQMATRYYMNFLNNEWAQLSPAELATWSTAPNPKHLPAYNLFLAYNLNRFKDVAGDYWTPNDDPAYPSTIYPATRATNPGIWGSHSRSPDRSNFWLQFAVPTMNDDWMTFFHYISTAEPKATYRTLVWAERTHGPGLHRYYLPTPRADSTQVWFLNVSRTGTPKLDRYAHWTIPV